MIQLPLLMISVHSDNTTTFHATTNTS